MSLPELLHPSLHALPDVTLAVDPRDLRILDVNRTREVFGRERAELSTAALDALVELPHDDLVRLVQAADARPVDVGVRLKSGAVVHASACASSSAGAAAAPCVLVVLRESPEHARALDEVERIRGVLSGALDALEKLSERRRVAEPPASIEPEASTEPPAPRLPELSLAQYVSLCVEGELQPARMREINERYGLFTEAARALLDRNFREKLAADPALEAERAALHARYLAWFQAQGRARGESGVLAAPAVAPAAELPKPMPPPAVRATALSAGVPPPAALPFAPAPAAAEGAAPAAARALPPPAAPPQPAPAPQPAAMTDVRATMAVGDIRFGAGALPFKPAGMPELTVEQYAALMVELEAYPEKRGEVLAMYGIHTDAAWTACDEHWTARLVGDPALRQRWIKLSADLKKKLVRS